MTNTEKLNEILCDVFITEENQLADLKFGSKNWDSIGHMQMISKLEETFGISISPDDIVKMGTYDDVKKVLEESCGVNF